MIALLDYGAGNLRSVAHALEHLGIGFEIVREPDRLDRAERVIFPGVGAAASCMATLEETGLADALRATSVPVLGICLGMQVFTESSTEGVREVRCLGVLPGRTTRLEGRVKRPQIGWNTLEVVADDPLLDGIESGEHFYFAHSYRVHTDPVCVIAETEYGQRYPSAVRHGNFAGVQFHPEKSDRAGLRVLRNFVERC